LCAGAQALRSNGSRRSIATFRRSPPFEAPINPEISSRISRPVSASSLLLAVCSRAIPAARTTSSIWDRVRVTVSRIWDVCEEVSEASLPTSSATTANPRPCSPARAASIAALSASSFVWLAIRWMIAENSSILASSFVARVSTSSCTRTTRSLI
jgi:hypothetical protein